MVIHHHGQGEEWSTGPSFMPEESEARMECIFLAPFPFCSPTGEDWGADAGERASATVQLAGNHPGRGGSRCAGASWRFVKA